MRGLERAVWPPHPSPLPRNTHRAKATSIAGEREQNPTSAYYCDAPRSPIVCPSEVTVEFQLPN